MYIIIRQSALSGIELGKPETVGERLRPLLDNVNLFGASLIDAGLYDKILGYFEELIAAPGAVRATLKKYLD